MQPYEKICNAVYAAIDELNATWPDLALKRSPDTVLIGPDAALDSTSFVELIVTTEQNIEEALGQEAHVMDILEEVQSERWTVKDLTERIAERMGCLAGQ